MDLLVAFPAAVDIAGLAAIRVAAKIQTRISQWWTQWAR